MTARCRGCGHRLRRPSPDGLGPVCRTRLAGHTTPARTVPSAPAAGQLPLEDHMTDTTAREALYADLMRGGPHSPYRSERASDRIDAFKAEVLAEAKTETVGWLEKKAREHRSQGAQYAKQADLVDKLASKVDRGAIRSFLAAESVTCDRGVVCTPRTRCADHAEPAAVTRQCGHDDYHDPHEWAGQAGTWCPGHVD